MQSTAEAPVCIRMSTEENVEADTAVLEAIAQQHGGKTRSAFSCLPLVFLHSVSVIFPYSSIFLSALVELAFLLYRDAAHTTHTYIYNDLQFSIFFWPSSLCARSSDTRVRWPSSIPGRGLRMGASNRSELVSLSVYS